MVGEIHKSTKTASFIYSKISEIGGTMINIQLYDRKSNPRVENKDTCFILELPVLENPTEKQKELFLEAFSYSLSCYGNLFVIPFNHPEMFLEDFENRLSTHFGPVCAVNKVC